MVGKIMLEFVCFEGLADVAHQLHDRMIARLTDNGTVFELFTVTNEVKQGWVIVPTSFSLVFPAMLMHAYSGPHRLQDRGPSSQQPAYADLNASLYDYFPRPAVR
ncbi:hypothetical protein SprV_0401625700 [Sparganum proliferum]